MEKRSESALCSTKVIPNKTHLIGKYERARKYVNENAPLSPGLVHTVLDTVLILESMLVRCELHTNSGKYAGRS